MLVQTVLVQTVCANCLCKLCSADCLCKCQRDFTYAQVRGWSESYVKCVYGGFGRRLQKSIKVLNPETCFTLFFVPGPLFALIDSKALTKCWGEHVCVRMCVLCVCVCCVCACCLFHNVNNVGGGVSWCVWYVCVVCARTCVYICAHKCLRARVCVRAYSGVARPLHILLCMQFILDCLEGGSRSTQLSPVWAVFRNGNGCVNGCDALPYREMYTVHSCFLEKEGGVEEEAHLDFFISCLFPKFYHTYNFLLSCFSPKALPHVNSPFYLASLSKLYHM